MALMAHAAGEPADGRHAPRELQFSLDLLHRFQVVQRDQRAESLPQSRSRLVVVDKIQRCLNAAARFGANLYLRQGRAPIEGIAERKAQHRLAVEDF